MTDEEMDAYDRVSSYLDGKGWVREEDIETVVSGDPYRSMHLPHPNIYKIRRLSAVVLEELEKKNAIIRKSDWVKKVSVLERLADL